MTFGPKYPNFGLKLHFFVPSNQLKPHRSTEEVGHWFPDMRVPKVLLCPPKKWILLPKLPNFAQNWHRWPNVGFFGPFEFMNTRAPAVLKTNNSQESVAHCIASVEEDLLDWLALLGDLLPRGHCLHLRREDLASKYGFQNKVASPYFYHTSKGREGGKTLWWCYTFC